MQIKDVADRKKNTNRAKREKLYEKKKGTVHTIPFEVILLLP